MFLPACAGQMAAAVHGLNPKINIWTQGEGASSSDAMAPLRNLFTSLPPMLVSYFAPLHIPAALSAPRMLNLTEHRTIAV